MVQNVIDRLASDDIGADRHKLHRMTGKRFHVEDVDLAGNGVIAELRIEQVAR